MKLLDLLESNSNRFRNEAQKMTALAYATVVSCKLKYQTLSIFFRSSTVQFTYSCVWTAEASARDYGRWRSRYAPLLVRDFAVCLIYRRPYWLTRDKFEVSPNIYWKCMRNRWFIWYQSLGLAAKLKEMH